VEAGRLLKIIFFLKKQCKELSRGKMIIINLY